MFEKGVAPRQQEHVEVAGADQGLGDFPFVDPRSDRLDRARRAQFVERAVATPHEFLDAPVSGFLAAVGEDVNVVGIDNVDLVEPKTLEREFERAPYAVVGIVEAFAPRRRLKKRPLARAVPWLAQLEQAADLARDQVGIARLRTQESVQSSLGKSKAVERRSVEISTTSRPDGLEHHARFLLRHRSIKIAQRRSAESEFGELQFHPSARCEFPCAHAPRIRRRHRDRPSPIRSPVNKCRRQGRAFATRPCVGHLHFKSPAWSVPGRRAGPAHAMRLHARKTKCSAFPTTSQERREFDVSTLSSFPGPGPKPFSTIASVAGLDEALSATSCLISAAFARPNPIANRNSGAQPRETRVVRRSSLEASENPRHASRATGHS